MKATLAYAYATAPATSLCLLCCICHSLSNLCLCKCLLLLSGHDLDTLPTCNLRPTRRTVIPVTRSTTGVLATHHAEKLTDKPLKDGELSLKRLGLNPYP
jgi:hypothetical protein